MVPDPAKNCTDARFPLQFAPTRVESVGAVVDVVVVSYNSRDSLLRCVGGLLGVPEAHVVVVDNASPDRSLDVLDGLPVTTVQLDTNLGFGHGNNRGVREGRAPFVLFLNPDAAVDRGSLLRLVGELESNPEAAAAAPRILGDDGELHQSLRRFPRLSSTYAQALFLHRLFPHALWTDELIRRPQAYERPGEHEWVSGAAILVRRDAFEAVGGFDEGFFLYCEDTDLCARLRAAGGTVRYVPDAVVHHVGGASAPRPSLFPVAVASRVRYAHKHRTRALELVERAGIALGIVTHLLLARGADTRRGHVRSLRSLLMSQHGRTWPDGQGAAPALTQT